jgi:hypothetical protein
VVTDAGTGAAEAGDVTIPEIPTTRAQNNVPMTIFCRGLRRMLIIYSLLAENAPVVDGWTMRDLTLQTKPYMFIMVTYFLLFGKTLITV